MTDSVTATAPAPKTKTVKKNAPKAKVSASHPTYNDMMLRSIKALKERKGSSRQGLLKYIMANFNVGADPKAVNAHLKMALKRGITTKVLKQSSGTGAQGRFRIGEGGEKKENKVVKKASPKKATTIKKMKSPTKNKAAPKTKKPSPKKVATPKKLKSPTKPKLVAKKATTPKKAKVVVKKTKKASPKKAVKK